MKNLSNIQEYDIHPFTHSLQQLGVYQQFNSVSTDSIVVGISCVFKYNTYILENGSGTNMLKLGIECPFPQTSYTY